MPLFNLVYHDCVLIPWKMAAGEWGIPRGTTGFLHCLLNGGLPYLSDTAEGETLEENIRQVHLLSELNLQVGMEKMVDHLFLSEDRRVQCTVFEGGTKVTVDFGTGNFEICYPSGRTVNQL